MLGHKNLSNYRLGLKSHSTHSLGNKQYSGIKNGQTVGTLSPDGVIHNYSNSAEVAKEPMMGVPINTHRKKFIDIEKHKKSHGSKNDKFA